ncbi:YjcZ family sporulation protein [Sporolactobacillus sp. THM7-7]|nr:YjcZ family sporulation protein [Sporolactobacillus sp. THM7-7]
MAYGGYHYDWGCKGYPKQYHGSHHYGYGGHGFALIVVLFILLIIVGTAFIC